MRIFGEIKEDFWRFQIEVLKSEVLRPLTADLKFMAQTAVCYQLSCLFGLFLFFFFNFVRKKLPILELSASLQLELCNCIKQG